MRLKDICIDMFTVFEEDGTEVTCYFYHITEVADLYMIQGETLNRLSWVHIEGLESAMAFWEDLKRNEDAMKKIEGDV